MAGVALENWVERIRDPKIECMSRDEMADLQSKRLVDVVKRVYENVDFYRKKMQQRGVEPGDIKSIEDIEKLPFTTKEDLKNNYPFGLLAIPMKDVVRVQGTSGSCKRTYDGRTYFRGYYSCVLRIRPVYRRHGS